MHLSRSLIDKYTKDSLPARDAQRLAQFIAWGPVVFQASRLMIKFGILDMIQESENGLTRQEIVEKTNLSEDLMFFVYFILHFEEYIRQVLFAQMIRHLLHDGINQQQFQIHIAHF